LHHLKYLDNLVPMFDYQEAYRIIGEPLEGLNRAEIEERLALNREFLAWIDERRTRAFARLAALEAGE